MIWKKHVNQKKRRKKLKKDEERSKDDSVMLHRLNVEESLGLQTAL